MLLQKITNVSNLLIIVILEESNNMTATALVRPEFYGVDSDGNPLSWGKLHAYEAGTLGGELNRKVTWSDPLQVTANANPIILNGSGRADVYLSGSYKLILEDSDGVTVWEQDNVYSSSPSEWVEDAEATYISTKSFSIIGNKTTVYSVNRAIQVQSSTGVLTYSHITGTSYANSITTIVVEDAIIDTTIDFVSVSLVTIKSLPSEVQDILDGFGRIGHNYIKNPDRNIKKHGYTGFEVINHILGDVCWEENPEDPQEMYQYIPEEQIKSGQYTLTWEGGGNGNVAAFQELESGTSPLKFDLSAGQGNVKVTVPNTVANRSTRIKFEDGPRNTGDENRPIDIERVLCAPFFREWVGVAVGDYLGLHAEAVTTREIEIIISLNPPMFKVASFSYSNVVVKLSRSNIISATLSNGTRSTKYAHEVVSDAEQDNLFTIGRRYEVVTSSADGYVRLDANIRAN